MMIANLAATVAAVVAPVNDPAVHVMHPAVGLAAIVLAHVPQEKDRQAQPLAAVCHLELMAQTDVVRTREKVNNSLRNEHCCR